MCGLLLFYLLRVIVGDVTEMCNELMMEYTNGTSHSKNTGNSVSLVIVVIIMVASNLDLGRHQSSNKLLTLIK